MAATPAITISRTPIVTNTAVKARPTSATRACERSIARRNIIRASRVSAEAGGSLATTRSGSGSGAATDADIAASCAGASNPSGA
ncbi:hypothetical protein CHKEEEPN_3203 [Methylorubrum podarium]|nr:hypothetical protein CHKEEEPN_3203 [Methylorubrum podarium]